MRSCSSSSSAASARSPAACITSFLYIASSNGGCAVLDSGEFLGIQGAAVGTASVWRVLGHHHDRRALLPQGHHGRSRADRSAAQAAKRQSAKEEGRAKQNGLGHPQRGKCHHAVRRRRRRQQPVLDIYEGEIVALIGPNGAGKTTAFNCITGVYEPTNGHVEFMGEPSSATIRAAR